MMNVRRLCPWAGVMVGALAAAAALAVEPEIPAGLRTGRVEFSDGRILEGRIIMGEKKHLRLHTGKREHSIDIETVRRITLEVEEEEMTQEWSFPEAGKTLKEKKGEPYPLVSYAAEILLASGERLRGHLFTTVLYAIEGDAKHKVILYSKRRGVEGESATDVVYPAVVSFDAASVSEPMTFSPHEAGISIEDEIAALDGDSLLRLTVRRKDGVFIVDAPWAKTVFFAARKNGPIRVGWPPERDDTLAERMRGALKDVKNFFDGRELAGVYWDKERGKVFTLMVLRRLGKTSLDNEKNRPWCVDVWGWLYDPEADRVMLDSRGTLFRGIAAPGETPPTVELLESLWNASRSAAAKAPAGVGTDR